ncbi:DUF6710 family protein [Streptococcus sp. zg-JUN1979]|uniref:DUF6710 family protein n=1 Tax=Streptococcus sp. zg-JUN1979 TaxID=3391450 RepID=UPI0039A58895
MFSSFVSDWFDTNKPSNAFIFSNINNSPKNIYYKTIYDLINDNDTTHNQIKAVSLKFQKILSLEIEQFIIQRMLNGHYANHLQNQGGRYEIIPTFLKCYNCQKEFKQIHTETKIPNLNINLFPVVCTLWNHHRLPENLKTIGQLVNNPFKANLNHRATYFYPLNVTVVQNGNHSGNVALYESNTKLKNLFISSIEHWYSDIIYKPQDNAFYHINCNCNLTPTGLFHENIGYLYELSKLLYENDLTFDINDLR